jgi:hypothetical protein
MSYERVHVDWDFWDIPRSGIADFEGRPHFFACHFDDELDDWTNRYRLSPASPEMVALAIEKDAIFRRWRAASDGGETDISTWPALPTERARYDELNAVLEQARSAASEKSIQRVGRFRRIRFGALRGLDDWEVLWRAPED